MNLRALLYFRKKERKAAFILVSVLMLGTLLISCATAFSWFVRLQVLSIYSERGIISSRSMAQVITEVISKVLYEVAGRSSSDNFTQEWFKPFVIPLIDEELGIWVIQVIPLDDKIPLRNLFLPDGNTLRRELNDIWDNLWEKLEHRELNNLMLDFLDRNKRPRVGGAERDNFINRGPYDMSELLILSEDVTPEILSEINKYCTIWSEGRINLNVAPLEVLELLPGLDNGLAERLIRHREENPIEKLSDVQTVPGASSKTSIQLTNIAGFKSRYFEIKIQCIDTEGSSGRTYSIIFDRTGKQIVNWEEI